MSLQDEAEASARRQAGESTSVAAVASGSAPPPTETSGPEQTPVAAAVVPESVTQPLHNANDPNISVVPGDSGNVPVSAGDEEMDEDEMLRRAKAVSKGDHSEEDVVMAESGEDEADEEAAIARAIAMSLEEPKGEEDKKHK